MVHWYSPVGVRCFGGPSKGTRPMILSGVPPHDTKGSTYSYAPQTRPQAAGRGPWTLRRVLLKIQKVLFVYSEGLGLHPEGFIIACTFAHEFAQMCALVPYVSPKNRDNLGETQWSPPVWFAATLSDKQERNKTKQLWDTPISSCTANSIAANETFSLTKYDFRCPSWWHTPPPCLAAANTGAYTGVQLSILADSGSSKAEASIKGRQNRKATRRVKGKRPTA